MCGRYTLTVGQRSLLEDRFSVALPEGGLHRFNVAPTEQILAVAADAEIEGGRRGRLVTWGLIPAWAKDRKGAARLINARSETVAERRTFAPLLERRRCLIPADGFYEWLRAEGRSGPKAPVRFTVDGGSPFAFAGLWTRARIGEETVTSATILTTAPNPLVARLHDRMPVILDGPDAEAAWLSPQVPPHEALDLCRPFDAGRMAAAPADVAVNRPDPEHEGPHLLVPGAGALV